MRKIIFIDRPLLVERNQLFSVTEDMINSLKQLVEALPISKLVS
jgi:hypothetical protein